MTRRTRLVAVATFIVVAGLAVRPFLRGGPAAHEHRPALRPTVAAVADPAATAAATAAAVRTLACRPAPGHSFAARRRSATPQPRWCGRYTVARTETLCRSDDACAVQMIGTLTTPAATSVVALTVTLRRVAARWQVTGMRS